MKKSYIILICAIIIAVVVWFVEQPFRQKTGDFKPFNLFSGLSEKEISKIEVEQLINGVVLIKDGSSWQVAELTTEMGRQITEGSSQKIEREVEKGEKGEEKVVEEGRGRVGEDRNHVPAAKIEHPRFRADSEKADKLVELIAGLEATSLVSTNPEKQITYQVNKIAKQARVYDAAGKILAHLYIGKNGPDMFSTYVRREADDEVYLVSEYLGPRIKTDVMSWRDKNIWKLDPGTIVGLEIKRPHKGESFSLNKNEDGTWVLKEPSEKLLDTGRVEEVVGQLSEMVASNFASAFDKKDTGLDEPSVTLTLTDTEMDRHTLLVGSSDPSGYLYAQSTGGGETYLMPSNLPSKIPSDWASLMPEIEKGE